MTVRLPVEGSGRMIRALIVDDEPHAREELESLLDETGAFEVVGRCANAVEAIQAIRARAARTSCSSTSRCPPSPASSSCR